MAKKKANILAFVIMLDDYLEVMAHFWPISKQSTSLESLRKVTQFSGNPIVVPRSAYTMTLIENKSLIDAATGQVKSGGIYSTEEV